MKWMYRNLHTCPNIGFVLMSKFPVSAADVASHEMFLVVQVHQDKNTARRFPVDEVLEFRNSLFWKRSTPISIWQLPPESNEQIDNVLSMQTVHGQALDLWWKIAQSHELWWCLNIPLAPVGCFIDQGLKLRDVHWIMNQEIWISMRMSILIHPLSHAFLRIFHELIHPESLGHRQLLKYHITEISLWFPAAAVSLENIIICLMNSYQEKIQVALKIIDPNNLSS